MQPVRDLIRDRWVSARGVFRRSWLFIVIAAAGLSLGTYQVLLAAPSSFDSATLVSVPYGSSAPEISAQLVKAHIISEPRMLRLILRLGGASTRIQAGSYLFESPQNVVTVARRLVTGDYGIPPVRFTFIEGETARDAAKQIAEAFPTIGEDDFLSAAQPYEGYLFPDTYLLPPSATAKSIVQTMRENFDTKTAALLNPITITGRSANDIVTMASLIEREARSSKEKKLIAGVLWNRLALGMPLQVDAVFGYIFGRDTYSPSYADLKVDSPYNTYTHGGLPPGPIGNPGLESLEAALDPTPTKYLYYLTGRDGLMHYATTYADHQANQRKYLN